MVLAVAAVAACSGGRAANEATALDYFKRGNAAYHREDYRHAIRMYQQAAELDSRSAVIPYNLGLACYQAGDYPEAVRALKRALRLDPTMAEAHRNLALAEDRLYNLEAAQTHYTLYQAMLRAREADAPAAAPGPAGGGEQAAPAPGAKPKAAAAPAARPGSGAGAPEPVSRLRRYGAQSTPNDQPAQPKGDGKWWTQDSSRRTQ
jgi:tetratricopeptide (TPR) repeat protein